MTCVEQLTCGPFSGNFTIMDVFTFYNLQYGIPNAVILGLFLGILIAGIYLWTRSLNILVILGVYCVSIVGATWANETSVQPAYQSAVWIIALAIASLITIMVLKLTRE